VTHLQALLLQEVVRGSKWLPPDDAWVTEATTVIDRHVDWSCHL